MTLHFCGAAYAQTHSCLDQNCVDDVCSQNGCQNGCDQWYFATETQPEYNCSTHIPEIDSTAAFFITGFNDQTVTFHIAVETQIDANLGAFYSYSIEHSASELTESAFLPIRSPINHTLFDNAHIIEETKVKLSTNTAHWFRLKILRTQNTISSSGLASKPVGLFIAEQTTNKKRKGAIIALVVLLTFFVTSTAALGVLANYLARQRYKSSAHDSDDSSKNSNATLNDSTSMSRDLMSAEVVAGRKDEAEDRKTKPPRTSTINNDPRSPHKHKKSTSR